jgi:pimeloyl-ACP methyl ester carboxylesterase
VRLNDLPARFIDVNGVSTRYYDYGQGDTIVLAGVGTSGANFWLRNIRGLANKFRVLAVDELGDGMTNAPKMTRISRSRDRSSTCTDSWTL